MSGWCLSEDENDDCMLCEQVLTHVEKERTLGLLNDAIDSFEPSRKTAYLEAKAKCILERESDPMMFLRRANFDPWQAAARLLEYWEQRVELFGRDRAFRRLFDLSGDGCLNHNDIEVLNSGFYVELPNDEYGHSVIMYDRRRISAEHRVSRNDSEVRAVVYTLARAALNPLSQTEGVVFLILINMQIEDPRVVRTLARFLHPAAPLKFHRLHMMYVVQSPRNQFFRLPPDLQRIFEHIHKGISLPNSRRFHFGRGPEDFSSQLQSYGLSIDNLPPSLGGTWTYANFACRFEMQKCLSISDQSEHIPARIDDEPIPSLTWQELVKRILGTIDDDQTDPLLWEVPLARLKRALFGSRANLTADTTGFGALTLMDLYAVNTSFLQILDVDDQSRTVISIESNLLQVSTDDQMRTLFYMLSVAAENPMSFKRGIVLLIILDSQFFLKSFGLEYVSEMLELFHMTAIVHVVLEPPAFDMPSIVFRANIPIRLGSLITGSNVFVHEVADNLVETLRSKHGLTVLLQSIGGTYTKDEYRQWRIDRHVLEASREFARVCRSLQPRDIVGNAYGEE